MELLNDYDFELSYHPGKANVVADALSRKSLSVAWMMIKEEELMNQFKELKLGIQDTPNEAYLSQLQISSDFKASIRQAQLDDSHFQSVLQRLDQERVKQDHDGMWRYKDRICIPDSGSLRQDILVQAHKSGFTVHPGTTKMYHDLKQMFWWPRMKNDVAGYVSKCLTCQKVKIEHQKLSGML